MFRKSEHAVARQIRLHTKLRTKNVGGWNLPHDIVAGKVRVEVKDSELIDGEWFFNIHRHGKVDERDVDVYVLVCRGLTKCGRVFVVVPAPIKHQTVAISPRSLFGRYGQYINNWEPISKINRRRNRRAA